MLAFWLGLTVAWLSPPSSTRADTTGDFVPGGRTSCSVSVASVHSRVSPRALAAKDPARIVRTRLEKTLGSIDCRREKIAQRYDILAEVVEAETVADKTTVRSRVKVQAIVRDASGAMLAIVGGRAEGTDRSSARASLESELLEAAAQKASSSVPEAIRRARGTN